jgi:hypothetical protein
VAHPLLFVKSNQIQPNKQDKEDKDE